MTTRFALIFVLLTLMCAGTVRSNDTTLTCSMFRMKLKDGTSTGGTSGRIIGSSFTGIDWDKKQIHVASDQIVQMDSAAGSRALQFATYGAMVGVGSAVALHISRTKSRNASTNKSQDPFLVGALVTAGSTAVGMLIGCFFTEWEPVIWTDSDVTFSVAGTVSINLSIRF